MKETNGQTVVVMIMDIQVLHRTMILRKATTGETAIDDLSLEIDQSKIIPETMVDKIFRNTEGREEKKGITGIVAEETEYHAELMTREAEEMADITTELVTTCNLWLTLKWQSNRGMELIIVYHGPGILYSFLMKRVQY